MYTFIHQPKNTFFCYWTFIVTSHNIYRVVCIGFICLLIVSSTNVEEKQIFHWTEKMKQQNCFLLYLVMLTENNQQKRKNTCFPMLGTFRLAIRVIGTGQTLQVLSNVNFLSCGWSHDVDVILFKFTNYRDNLHKSVLFLLWTAHVRNTREKIMNATQHSEDERNSAT